MSKRKSRKSTSTGKEAPSTAGLRAALNRCGKTELVNILLDLAHDDQAILKQLKARFDLATVPADLIAATRRAIADATDFDERLINHNFDYDFEAYEEVKRNLARLIAAEQWGQTMQLALELMKEGSFQVEMSDEGLMTDDIEDCLSVVIQGLKKCDLSATEIVAWCSAMLDKDRVKFIAREELEALRDKLQAKNR